MLFWYLFFFLIEVRVEEPESESVIYKIEETESELESVDFHPTPQPWSSNANIDYFSASSTFCRKKKLILPENFLQKVNFAYNLKMRKKIAGKSRVMVTLLKDTVQLHVACCFLTKENCKNVNKSERITAINICYSGFYNFTQDIRVFWKSF